MATINYGSRELICKIVYCGPGFGGKTTNLMQVHDRLPDGRRGELTSLDTAQDRTLYFDLLPVELGRIGSFFVKVQIYTVPGQVQYAATRRMVLSGVDGVVMVFDSSPERENANYVSLADLEEHLTHYGIEIDRFPVVFQYNKRDVKDCLDRDFMSRSLNPDGHFPEVDAVAVEGVGVTEAFRKICSLVFARLEEEHPALNASPPPETAASSSTRRDPAADGMPNRESGSNRQSVAARADRNSAAGFGPLAGRQDPAALRRPAYSPAVSPLRSESDPAPVPTSLFPIRQLCDLRLSGLLLAHGSIEVRPLSAGDESAERLQLALSLQPVLGPMKSTTYEMEAAGLTRRGSASLTRFTAVGADSSGQSAPLLFRLDDPGRTIPSFYVRVPFRGGRLDVRPHGESALRPWPRSADESLPVRGGFQTDDPHDRRSLAHSDRTEQANPAAPCNPPESPR